MYERRNGFRHVHMGLQGNPKKTKDSKFFFAIITLKNENFFPTHTHIWSNQSSTFVPFLVIQADFSFYAVSASIPQPQPQNSSPSPPLPGAARAARNFWREVEKLRVLVRELVSRQKKNIVARKKRAMTAQLISFVFLAASLSERACQHFLFYVWK